MDIRLETMPFQFNGKEYLLRCNMNVLADVQEYYKGDFASALGSSTMKSALVFLSAMLNDYADEKGWDERFTPKQLGRIVSLKELPMAEILGLVTRAVTPEGMEEDEPKN